MWSRFLAVSLLLAPLTGAQLSPYPPPPLSLTVNTSSGIFTGFTDPSLPDTYQWLGIPYAQPPTGTRRFMPPEKALWDGAHTAQAYKPICLQDTGDKVGVYWELVPEYQNRDAESEDCLYLNIWGPRTRLPGSPNKLPVIIWVVGGGFKEGGGHADYYVPDRWIERTQTHLVVTFNYRLNIFGFPGSPAANLNVGLMDIRLVIKWLKDNIDGFGGDPNRMVLWGHSAGANAVIMYGYAHPEKPIVRGLIAGSSGTPTITATSSSVFHDLAQVIGCANLSSAAELACVQAIDPFVLRDAVDAFNTNPFRGLFRPIADGVTVFANLTERLENGQIANIPLIAGYTWNEPAAFLEFDPLATSPPAPTVPGTEGLACGIKREALNRVKYGLTTYRYLFSGDFINTTPRYWLGGMHCSELPLVFGTHHLYRGNSTEFEWQTSFAMESFWVAFASNSAVDPMNHLGQVWPKFVAADGDVVVFGNATGLSQSYSAHAEVADKFYAGFC
ncbi:acetylcholinesterase [Podospora conica]|nr:acetylcholinesterase [Schizothecium conicum]